ncbi:MAG: 30S ribosomal protein S20 [Dehalococcoidia bacterium]
MPSAKTLKVQRRKAERNKAVRSFTRSRVTRARAAVSGEPEAESTATALRQAFSALDRAASKGVIHRNTAARRKSRLARRLNSAAQAE